MASLPGRYAAPEGRLFYATVDGKGAGCVGVRPLAEGVCELKRLYVEPAFAASASAADWRWPAYARRARLGYRKIMLDTLPAMRIAVKLYRELGFDEAPAYYQTPVEGTQFLALDLENWSEDATQQAHPASPVRLQSRLVEQDARGRSGLLREALAPADSRAALDRLLGFDGCPPTKSSACCRARSSSIAMSPTSSCIPT
jgi:hypothetical protein